MEFLRGFRRLHFVGPCVTVFGSARLPESDPFYQAAVKIGAGLGNAGFSVMTGGGPGIMEAANRGAREVGARSVAASIKLEFESDANPYLDQHVEFEYFFVRKVLLLKYSYGFVIMPGGVGTLDEFFETLTLIQTKKIVDFPVVLFGSDFFQPLVDFMRDTMVGKTISAHDMDLFLVTDDVDEAVRHISQNSIKKFGLRYSGKPSKLLAEG